MKVSQWLAETLDSHGIYDAELIQKSFEEKTGKKDLLPSHTVKETRRLIASDYRGGEIYYEGSGNCVYGYEVAAFLARKYGSPNRDNWKHMTGRGFLFRAAIESIKQAENEQ